MTTPHATNGEWNEYRRLILSWHEDEVIARRDIQEKLETASTLLTGKLDTLSSQITDLKAERRVVLVLMGVVAPILISAAVSLALK